MAKILIIDDERSIRNALKDVLEFEGYVIELAEDGLKGLEMIKSTKYDLIFCDIKMPTMDGIEVLSKIREEYPDQMIVMISGHGTVDSAVECIKKGAFDFIEKPLDLNRLLVCVRNALDHKSLVQETKVLKKKVEQKMKEIRNINENCLNDKNYKLVTNKQFLWSHDFFEQKKYLCYYQKRRNNGAFRTVL